MATASPSNATPESKPRPRWKRLARAALACVAIPYVGLASLLTVFQRSMIYLPTRAASLPASRAMLPTASAELVTTTAADGIELHGWWLTTTRPVSDDGRAGRPLIVFFCGNGGHREYRLVEFEIFTERGADVLCFDYRGYGDNPGSPSEEGLATDARAAWNFATQSRGVSADRIVLYGESLGGGVAVRLAAELCGEQTPPAGLVLRSTFSSLVDVASQIYPWMPVRWLLRDRFESDRRIGEVSCPLLMLHGKLDTIVPLSQGRKLFNAAPAQSKNHVPKQFVELPSADHNDVIETEGSAFTRAIGEFLRGLD